MRYATHCTEQAEQEVSKRVQVDPTIFRPANFIERALHNLSRALLLGSLLMVIMLFFFLWEWRVALISVVAMPLSLLGAILVLHLRGATINTMILAGLVIALGDVVDDAIIDIENVVRRLREHRRSGSDRSTAAVILGASVEVRGAIIHATVIEVVQKMFNLPATDKPASKERAADATAETFPNRK